MKLISIFILLIYWSVIILAPVLAKNDTFIEKRFVLPIDKPSM